MQGIRGIQRKRFVTAIVFRVICATAVSLLIAKAEAGTGNVVSVKVGSAKIGTILKVTLDSRWVSGDGYRPLRINVVTVGGVALPRDRQLTIRLRPNRSYPSMPELTIKQTFDIPAGSNSFSEIIYLPEDPETDYYKARMWIGDLDHLYSETPVSTHGSSGLASTTPRVLVVDHDAPTFAELGSRSASSFQGEDLDKIANPVGIIRSAPLMLGSNNNDGTKWAKDKKWSDVVDDVPSCTIISPSDIPPRWIGLTNLDIVCISLDDLVELQQLPDLRAQWDSLTDWTRAGGNLWITNGGEAFGRLSEAAKILGMRAPSKGQPPSAIGWRKANTKGYGDVLEELTFDPYTNRRGVVDTKLGKPEKKAPPNPIRYHDFQFGTVALFSAEDALENTDPWYWHWIFKSLDRQRWGWVERNGLSGIQNNPGFWEFMVPGVGLAPVKTFAFLLTMFVLCIGPFSFAILRRWQRPNWMMFTVPLAAALVTLTLVLYALLTDGLSVRGRLRTITHVDQRNEREATWSRQAYYAGLPPSEGLKFPQDTAVYPVDFAPLSRFIRNREIDLRPEQHLRRGYLGARDTSQFLVQSCGPTKQRLEFSDLEQPNPTVTNHLGSEIGQLFVRDRTGAVLHAGDIGVAAQVALEPVADSVAAAFAMKWSGRRCLIPPKGVDPSAIVLDRRYRFYRWNRSQAENEPEKCAAERIIAEFMTMPSGRYIAIMKTPGDIPVGIPNVRWEKTSHLIVGEW